MYNLLVTSVDNYWNSTVETSMGWDRVFEYTTPELKQAFMPHTESATRQLLGMPALFTYEFANRLPADDEDLPSPSRVGRIVEIRAAGKQVDIKFEIDHGVEPISAREIHRIAQRLDFKTGENYRSHWALKDIDLLELLKEEGLYRTVEAPDVEEALRGLAGEVQSPGTEPDGVFIVHGHDREALNDVARWIGKVRLQELVLWEQPSSGHTVLSKLVKVVKRAKYAVVLLTPDDIGGQVGGQQQYRPRQNVLLELGYVLAALGHERVAILTRGQVELPSDFEGVVRINYDTSNSWLVPLMREFNSAGLRFDLNGLL